MAANPAMQIGDRSARNGLHNLGVKPQPIQHGRVRPV
jgi:hypothetical protein